jgi:hypothetical protein
MEITLLVCDRCPVDDQTPAQTVRLEVGEVVHSADLCPSHIAQLVQLLGLSSASPIQGDSDATGSEKVHQGKRRRGSSISEHVVTMEEIERTKRQLNF